MEGLTRAAAAGAARCVLGPLLAVLPGCGQSAAGGAPEPGPAPAQWAWAGENGQGLRILVEALPEPEPEARGALREEAQLRRILHLDPERAVVRLHLVGPAPQLQEPGRLATGGGRAFDPLGEPPPGLDSRARNLWLGVGLGGPPPDLSGAGTTRRSFLLLADEGGAWPGAGEAAPPALEWRSDSQRIELQPRRFSPRERRDFLAGAALQQPEGGGASAAARR